MDPILGEIRMFAFNFAPPGWLLCDGASYPIANNAALYSLIGNTYGAQSETMFCVPDLRGRFPIGVGVGKGLAPVELGQIGGDANKTPESNIAKVSAGPTDITYATAPPENNLPPYLGVHFMIASAGIYPARS